MTRLEIAVRLLAGAWSDFPEEASDAELAESALNMADALLVGDAKRGVVAPPATSPAPDDVPPLPDGADGETASKIPGIGRIAHMDDVTRALHKVGLVWVGGGQWSEWAGGAGNHCVYVRVKDGLEVAGIAVSNRGYGAFEVAPQWRAELPGDVPVACDLSTIAVEAVRMADAIEAKGIRVPVKYEPEDA